MIDAYLHERLDGFSLQRVGHSDGGGLRDRGMRYQSALDFGGADAVPRNVQHVVGAAEYGDVSVLVFHGDIAGNVEAGEKLPVALVAGGIAPDGAQHAGEGALEDEPSAHAGRGRLAFFIEDICLGSRNGHANFSWAHRHGWRSAEGGAPEFCLPPVVDHVSPLAV